jgi:hypothetical protein
MRQTNHDALITSIHQYIIQTNTYKKYLLHQYIIRGNLIISIHYPGKTYPDKSNHDNTLSREYLLHQ